MLCHVGDHIDLADDAGVVDQERMSSRVLRVLFVGRPNDVVGGPDLLVDVAEQ
jgi:hypothetical protein